MNWIPLILIVGVGPVLLFLGWFRKPSWTWTGIWAAIGTPICAGFLIYGYTRPTMDWGFTSAFAWLWTAFFVVGGVVQAIRLSRHKTD